MVKMLAIFNLFSFGNYYINVIFYSFITLFGAIAIYRVMKDVFPRRNIAILLATFLVPSFIYWTSGIHKDGLIFLGFGLITYSIYFSLKEKNFSFTRLFLILLSVFIIIGFRNYLLIIITPAVIAWILADKLKFKPVYTYLAVYAVFVVLFFTARYVHERLDFPEAVVTKQQDFLKLSPGGSTVSINQLQPNFISFVLNAPQALDLSIVRPHPSDVRHLLSLAAATEINVLLFLFLVFMLFRRNGVGLNPFILFCIFLSFSTLITIGYTVNNLGAIVRYRSIVLPFLIIPMMAKIDWERLGGYIVPNIKKNNN
jgi:hypothetical protein